MPKPRLIRRRIISVRNIRKITRTMERVAQSKVMKLTGRFAHARSFRRDVGRLLSVAFGVTPGSVSAAEAMAREPLSTPRPAGRVLLVCVTSNRGLCGGYNSAVMRLANARWTVLRAQFSAVRLEVSGKRGISAFRFRGVQPDERFTHFEDRPEYQEVELLADRCLDSYRVGPLDRLEVVYTRFESHSRQKAVVETLLPLAAPDEAAPEEPSPAEVQYDFLPSAAAILDEVLPASIKVKLFKCFLDAAVSEQIARMMAMKAATENADAMISHLSISYNRARQGQITSELLEVIGGAEALRQ